MDSKRSDPDKLLKQLQNEETSARKGRLKIYLGAAPGVGKTYAMLEDAIEQKNKGRNVVIGIIESHGRKDIEQLLQSLERLPLQSIDYHNKTFSEFPLDDAIRQRPELILMDEMAHTNVPGLRHAKRWQDIRELLDNQIDVYTTLNVQHVESLHDDIARIIHAPIHETVPDFMLDLADSIELVDLPTEELLKRLHEGKIYLPDRAKMAAKHFFLPGNLIALRELALRTTAQRVGKQVQIYRQDRGIRQVWSSHEKIMVCVGPGVESLQLIRNGKQLAASFQCDWLAVHVNAISHPETEARRNNAVQHLRLAEQLGAIPCELEGLGIVETLMRCARDQNITLIMIWKAIRPRWRELFSGSIANELVRQSGEVDVYIMTGIPTDLPSAVVSIAPQRKPSSMSWLRWGLGLIAMTLAAVLSQAGIHPAIIVLFLGMSLTLGWIILLLERQVKIARLSAWHATTLHTLGKQLIKAADTAQIIQMGEKYLSDLFQSETTFFIADPEDNTLRSRLSDTLRKDQKNEDALLWVFRMGQMAGLGTDTLPLNDALYVPLPARQGTLGVLRIKPLVPGHLFLPEQVHLIEACASQISLALEVHLLKEETNQTVLDNTLEHARVEFMQSVAEDLHSPLSSILAYSKILETLASRQDPEKIQKTARLIQHESDKISHMINNILQISRLDEGEIQPVREPITLKNMIESLINERYHGEDVFRLDISENLTSLSADNNMIREVFLNLMDNAARVSPKSDLVRIAARKIDHMIEISVHNNGPGIPEEEIEKIFERYYKIHSEPQQGGLGLGLAICRKIIEAHGGKIWAENRSEGGTVFCFTLPIAKKKK